MCIICICVYYIYMYVIYIYIYMYVIYYILCIYYMYIYYVYIYIYVLYIYVYVLYICVYVLYIYICIIYIYVYVLYIYMYYVYLYIYILYIYMYYVSIYIYVYYIYMYYIYMYIIYIYVCYIYVCFIYIMYIKYIYIYVLLRDANTGVRCFWWQLMWLRLQPMLAAACSSPGILQLLWLLRLHWSTASLRFSKLGSRLCLPENISLTHGARAVIRWIYRKHLTIVVHIAVVQHCSYLWSLHLARCFAIPSLTIDIILHGRWSREHLVEAAVAFETQDARTR